MTEHNAIPRRVRGRSAVAAVGILSLVGAGLTFAGTAATAADAPASFFTDSSVWKYSDNNTDPSAGTSPYDRLAWAKAGFDDSAWKSAAGPFGAKSGSATPNLGAGFPVTTVLTQYIAGTTTDIPTEHFRSTFDVSAGQLDQIASLTGTVTYDDALQIFVNGTKVAGLLDDRVGAVPESQQNLTYAGVSNGDPVTSTFTVPASVLQAGTNTIAIALYNDRESSSDLYLALKSLVANAVPTGTPYGIILGVGADESQRIVTWYTDVDSDQVIQVAPTSQVSGDSFPAGAKTFSALGAANLASSGGYNRHATITGLAQNTQYSYRVGKDGAWSRAYSFATQSFEGDYDFLFFGDPQIGSSGDEVKDGAGWADTLDVALAANPDAELLVSGGDQVEVANTESQWTQFLAPDELRAVPWVATIGNHDVGGKAYEQHLYTPNTDRSASYYADGNPSGVQSGGDYWFIYKDVLFIDLNSNSYVNSDGTTGDDAHVQYVTDVVNAHGAEAKYTVLVYHHSIYSPASHANDSDNSLRRKDFTTAFSDLGVDLVLQGHDHSYSRSYEIKNGAKANPDEQPGAADVYQGPGGVIYVTANSASGSKYYDLTAPSTTANGGDFGPDPLNPQSHWANSVENQEHVRTYVKVAVQADQLVVENIRSGTCAAPNAAVELGNVSWCGTSGTHTAVGEVGSIVDSVTIHPYHGDGGQDIQVDVAGAPGEFGWAIDGYNGLVDLGPAASSGDYFEATGSINPITVTDTRRSRAPWSLSASVTDFQDGTNTFSGKYLGWTPKVITAGAGALAGGAVSSAYDGGDGLGVSRTLGWAYEGHDKGAAGLGADLDLKFPDSVPDGTYRATLTITALSS